MSFVNIGTDGPPNHTLEVEGDVFVSNVEDGTNTPVEIQGNLRLRNKPPGAVADEYRVMDMQSNNTLFGITGPSVDASRSITDFCIDSSGNVGIGVNPTEKLDVSGSMYTTGSLTNESNLITGTLSSTGTLTCNAIVHGVNSNIYGLLPSNVILMTTLTSTPIGWTDITSQFTDKNVLLAENQTLTTGGNNTQSLPAISHNHTANSHTTTHGHATAWNSTQLTSGTNGNHKHSLNFNNTTSIGSGNHAHSKYDIQVFNSGAVAPNFPGSNQDRAILTQNANDDYSQSGPSSQLTHGHSGASSSYSETDVDHSHTFTYNIADANDAGGNHTHTVSPAGSSNGINIVPPYYTLRFIKKN
jgi:hypothetical protein